MEWLAPISESLLAQALIGSATLYLLVNATHIMGIGILFGSVLALDLRLIGLGRSLPLAPAARYLSRLAAAGLALAIVTGLCLFSVRPLEYAGNVPFLSKLFLVTLGVINVLLVHRSVSWGQMRAGAEPPMALRVGAVFSLLIWTAAIIAGRWIGFV